MTLFLSPGELRKAYYNACDPDYENNPHAAEFRRLFKYRRTNPHRVSREDLDDFARVYL